MLVVEHDEDAIRAADHVVDMGLGAGEHGGASSPRARPQDIIDNEESLTGQYLRHACASRCRRSDTADPDENACASAARAATT